MTEKELRRMGRRELIEIIAAQKKRELELEQQLKKAKEQLENRAIQISKAGSIAEAALAVNHIFEAAQASADSYLQSLEYANANLELRIAQTQEECTRRLQETDRQCAQKLAAADAEIKRRTAAFQNRIRDYMQDHPELWES